MGGHHHAAPVRQGGNGVAEPQPLLRIEAHGRLVQHQQRRVAEQRLSDDQATAHPAGEPADPPAGLAGQARDGEHPAYLVMAGPAISPLLQDGDVVDIVEAGETGRESAFLRHIAQPATDLGTPVGQRTVVAEQADSPSRGRDDRCQDPQQRRLPGPVRPEQAEHTRAGVEADRVEGAVPSVGFAHIGETDVHQKDLQCW
jgi:hypothetical protein